MSDREFNRKRKMVADLRDAGARQNEPLTRVRVEDCPACDGEGDFCAVCRPDSVVTIPRSTFAQGDVDFLRGEALRVECGVARIEMLESLASRIAELLSPPSV